MAQNKLSKHNQLYLLLVEFFIYSREIERKKYFLAYLPFFYVRSKHLPLICKMFWLQTEVPDVNNSRMIKLEKNLQNKQCRRFIIAFANEYNYNVLITFFRDKVECILGSSIGYRTSILIMWMIFTGLLVLLIIYLLYNVAFCVWNWVRLWKR